MRGFIKDEAAHPFCFLAFYPDRVKSQGVHENKEEISLTIMFFYFKNSFRIERAIAFGKDDFFFSSTNPAEEAHLCLTKTFLLSALTKWSDPLHNGRR